MITVGVQLTNLSIARSDVSANDERGHLVLVIVSALMDCLGFCSFKGSPIFRHQIHYFLDGISGYHIQYILWLYSCGPAKCRDQPLHGWINWSNFMECEVWSLAYIKMLAAGLLSFFGSGGPKSYILPHDIRTPLNINICLPGTAEGVGFGV